MRPTRLSEIENSLNPELREMIQHLRDRIENDFTVQHTAGVLGVSSRRVYQLCLSQDLDFVQFPRRKIIKNSLILYILSRHGIDNIEIDDPTIHLNRPL
jgi:hypothetical protein